MKIPTHPPLAVAMQCALAAAISAAGGSLHLAFWIGAAFGTGFYLGRELDQAEHRWIQRYGAGRRANLPWWGQFDLRVWNAKSWHDWILPTLATATVAAGATHFN
jgi:hypothetical protein